jgi:hypothetical protein
MRNLLSSAFCKLHPREIAQSCAPVAVRRSACNHASVPACISRTLAPLSVSALSRTYAEIFVQGFEPQPRCGITRAVCRFRAGYFSTTKRKRRGSRLTASSDSHVCFFDSLLSSPTPLPCTCCFRVPWSKQAKAAIDSSQALYRMACRRREYR